MNDSIRIAFRADASSVIGLGHVKRCLALASALRDTAAQVTLLSRDSELDIAAMAREVGIEFIVIPDAANRIDMQGKPADALSREWWQVDADYCGQALLSWEPDWIVVDHYALDARWHRQVATAVDARVAVIDDLADRDLHAEMLVDHNLNHDHRAKYRGRIQGTPTFLVGPRFALLAPVYATAKEFVVNPCVRSIGIFMGGADAADFSSIAVRACREQAAFSGAIEIAITRAYPHRDSLEKLTRRWPDTKLLCDQQDLADFFSRHDLQIGAGGGAVWERCCVGAPTLALVAAPNQRATLPALAALGAVAVPGLLTDADDETLGRAVRALLDDPLRRRQLSERSRSLVDGLGARRVALWLAGAMLAVRPACMDDAHMIYAWRNHPAIRGVSRNTAPISWPDHLQWLQSSLMAPERCLLIGYVGEVDVGVVRFDVDATNCAEVSVYLDPALHGLRLGRCLLNAGEVYFMAERPSLETFVAIVLSGNPQSEHLFLSCGYQPQQGIMIKRPTRQAQEVQ